MRLTPRQAAALQPLITDKKLAEARITTMVRAFLLSFNVDPNQWNGSVDIDDLGNVTVLLNEPDAHP